jgi:hypothetical protein
MESATILCAMSSKPPRPVSSGELESLLTRARALRCESPTLAGPIRILAVGESIMVQEQTPQGQLFLRDMPSLEAAQRFVDDRLATYERMWDGCGCKVDYTS